jgi:type VI secretion system protein ImpJ
LISSYIKFQEPYFWGIGKISIEKSSLEVKLFNLESGEFLFPDGSFVSLEKNGLVNSRAFQDDWIEGGKPFTVYLGLKKWFNAGDNVTVLPKLNNISEVTTRFVAANDHETVKDLHAGGAEGKVKLLRYALKIFWEAELNQLGDYELLPIAQLERFGAEIRLSEDFIPPSLSITSTGLNKLIKEITDQVTARSHQLEEYKSKRGIQSVEFGARDMVYLLALRSINRYIPLLYHYMEAEHSHPWHVYGLLRQLIGELTTFSEEVSVLGEFEDGKKTAPNYDHSSLFHCFSSVQGIISYLLDEITAGPEYIIQLLFDGMFFTADIKPSVFEGRNRFFLAVKSDEDPAEIIKALNGIAKLSSKSHIDMLISRSLPGIGLNYIQVPPQELPRRTRTTYFTINQFDEQWAAVAKHYQLALYWNDVPEDVEIELMVVRGR